MPLSMRRDREILSEVPSIWATDRFLRAWREKHRAAARGH